MMQRPAGSQIISDRISAFAEDEPLARASRDERIKKALDQAATKTLPTKEMVAQYDALINRCHIMKRVLFNASKRLERKHAAGQFTFALSGIYGFLVPLFTLQFEPFLTALVTNVVSFTAAIAGAISFVVAMIYQQQDLGRQARSFHDAGLRMNKLRRHLKIYPFLHPDQLRENTHRYDDILVHCHNHDEIDFNVAQLGSRPRDNAGGQLDHWRSGRTRLAVKSWWHTYGLLAFVWLIPPLLGLAIWLTLSGTVSTASQIAR